MYQIFK